ncbi:MAG TPA: hypothetical protein VFE24_08610 [Pirellulales bacterium]|jgi:hypothetical protein|nr:hypothetical protein [Pirellulales bacterium]
MGPPAITAEIPSDYRWLTSAAAQPWLLLAANAADDVLLLTRRLREHLSLQQTHLVLEQVDLRRRAKAKFTTPEGLFFTRVGLEQATDEVVARYKAERFPRDRPVFDLCCGIGGDAMALATRGATIGVDRDPIAALFARLNLQQTRLANSARAAAEVRVAAVEELELSEAAAWHLDPDRRATGSRVTRVERYEPGPEVVERLLRACPAGAIKLAPAAELSREWSTAAESEWISRDGECKQLVAWFGSLAREPGRRCATILRNHSPTVRTVVGREEIDFVSARQVDRFVYEVDAAVLAARLTGQLAAEHGLLAIDPHGGYLTGPDVVQDAALTPFEVLETLAFDRKRLKGALAARGIGRLEIKKRGHFPDPAVLRRELATAGPESATLLLAQLETSSAAILARRIVVPQST